MRNLVSKLCLATAAFWMNTQATSAEEPMDVSKAQTIIQTFGELQMATADYLIADEKRLPFSKTEIKEAILFAIPLVDKEMCEQLRFGYVQLGMFQPVSEIRMLDIPDNISSLSDEQIFNFAKKVMVEFDEDWFAINRFVIDDMKSLLKEIPKC